MFQNVLAYINFLIIFYITNRPYLKYALFMRIGRSRSHVVTQSHGHMGTQSHGHLITWSHDRTAHASYTLVCECDLTPTFQWLSKISHSQGVEPLHHLLQVDHQATNVGTMFLVSGCLFLAASRISFVP